MKKNYFFLAAAALAFASCSVDETLEVNQGEAINFRTLVAGQTRATPTTGDVTGTNIEDFNVYAFKGTDAYFSDVDFTKQSNNSFTSANKYYWPGTDELTFYAYSPKAGTGIARSAYNTWTVTQQATPAAPDFVVAKTTASKSTSAAGVTINFRHAMSKLSLKVKNSNTGMKMEVKDWKVAYMYNQGTFSFIADDTDGKNSTTLAAGNWTYTGATQAVTNAVINGNVSAVTIAANTTTAAAVTGLNDFIVIPQTMKSGTPAYATNEAAAKWTTPYIAVLMTIKNAADGSEIVGETWCCWPISTAWLPGKHYTYTIDLAGGGYLEGNNATIGDDEATLDPVLDNAEIFFATVTVDDWSDETDINVANN